VLANSRHDGNLLTGTKSWLQVYSEAQSAKADYGVCFNHSTNLALGHKPVELKQLNITPNPPERLPILLPLSGWGKRQ
jgi:hypothetical protein